MTYRVIAIDPGTDKCGIAYVSKESGRKSQVLGREVVQISKLGEAIEAFLSRGPVDAVVLGGGTGSKAVAASLAKRFSAVDILVVDERHSTEQARQRYWCENPPRGWRRFIPRAWLTPPEPVDDFAAVLLAERVLDEMSSGQLPGSEPE